ncbi:uncharacterized protein LOC131245439 isoform X2 [Magnolia sinica]|uniref:uncharacterized protein LOC131245439 isoform X2 n=1 Tax=Magnolia sinica TaxID=86752 RepID=UPI00265B621B|nr:uncharacterized protein LOC131245439 isoform X2 [Magnolia sinica]
MISSLDPRPSIDSLWPMEQNNLCPRIPAGELETLESRVSHLAMGRQPDLEISPHPSVSSVEEQSEDGQSTTISNLPSQVTTPAQEGNTSIPQELVENNRQRDAGDRKQGRYFYYDPPLYEETGIWIPVSVPPMSESDHEEWRQGFGCNGGFFPEEEMSWGQFVGEDKELTMWDVLIEMLLAARGKMGAISSGELQRHGMSFISGALFEQAWKEMAQVLTEANFGNMKEILEREPPKWLADSAASSCMLCGVRFHPIMCSRHHCRFCGGIFCSECSRGRSLLPVKFRTGDPQRVCDVCYVRLESVQSDLRDQVSPAAQLPTHDLTDLSTLRSWVNFPWGQSMEYEIYKATNTIRGYNKGGGELTDFIIVLRTKEAVKTFSGNVHFSMGAGFSAAVGIVGRAAEADVRAGDGGCAASYTYSCSKGAFVGCSLEGSMVITRTSVNSCFYGSPSIKASDILLGSLPRPPAAAVLYHALSDLFQKLNE